MNEYKFKIDTKLPSLNEYINACRTSPRKGNEMKQETDWLCLVYIRRAKIPAIKKPVHIHFEWHEKTERRDLDGITGFGHKTILDALVKGKCLQDDRPKFVKGLSDAFVMKQDKTDFVIVTITELE